MNNEEKIKELESRINDLESDILEHHAEIGDIFAYLKKNDPEAFSDTGSFKDEALE